MPEAVVVATARSPIGRAFKGSLTSIRPDDLAAQIITAALGKVPQLDPADIYAGGRPRPIVLVELKLPAVALSTLERRARFIAAATAIVGELTVEDHDDGDTWVNILHAEDGAWGIGGVSLTNDMLTATGS